MTIRALLALALLQRGRRSLRELGAAIGLDFLGVAYLVHVVLAGHGHRVIVRGGHVELVAGWGGN